MYKLYVETSGKRARLVPSASKLGVAERNFGEIDRVAALSNIDSLEDAIKEMLEDKGIEDAELYVITLPDELNPRSHKSAHVGSDTGDRDPNDNGKGAVTEGEQRTETPAQTPETETQKIIDKTQKERELTGQTGENLEDDKKKQEKPS